MRRLLLALAAASAMVVPMAYNSDLLRAIRSESARTGVPENVLVATTLQESGGNPYGPGGDNQRSWGAWQEYDLGRGRGFTRAQRQDPYASTRRAATEFAHFMRKGYRGGRLAAAAQRPANPRAYAAGVEKYMAQANQILGGKGVGGFAGASVSTPTTDQLAPGAGGFDPKQLLASGLAGRRQGESLTSSVRRSLALDPNRLGSRPLVDGPPVGVVSAKGSAAADTAVVTWAKEQQGTPYSWGGGTDAGPSRGFGRGANTVGFDCSSLVKAAWAKVGVKIPRTTYGQINTGKRVRHLSEVRPGDLLFPSKGHVQMYIGNGMVIHSPRTGDRVRTARLGRSFIMIRRPGG